MRSLEELQYFMRYLLQNITGLEWRVALSKSGQDYSRYLISENGMVFSLIKKIFSKQDVASGYAYSYLTALDEDPVLGDEEKEAKKDKSRNRANVQIYVLVAATWFPDEMAPNKEVHHRNHNPLDNHFSNLVWVTPEEHKNIHVKDNHLKLYQTSKKDFQSVCSVCFEENRSPQNTECECKKVFCSKHLSIHQPNCFYYIERNNPVVGFALKSADGIQGKGCTLKIIEPRQSSMRAICPMFLGSCRTSLLRSGFML